MVKLNITPAAVVQSRTAGTKGVGATVGFMLTSGEEVNVLRRVSFTRPS